MRIHLIALLVLSMMLLFGCKGQQPAEQPGKEMPEAPADVADEATVQQAKESSLSDIEIMDKALRALDADLCTGIQNPGILRTCFDNVISTKAITYQDTVQCGQVSDETLKTTCLDEINKILIKREAAMTPPATPTAADCSTFPTEAEQQNCEDLKLKDQALESGDGTLCDTIQDADIKVNCKNNAYQNLAIMSLDPELCDVLSNPALTESCKNNVYANKATRTKDAGQCELITNQEMKERCISSLA